MQDYETNEYKVRHYDGVRVVRFKTANLTGILEVNRIGDEIKSMIDQGVRMLVLDFKHVEHCGSAALGMMIAVNRKMQEAKGRLILSHPEQIQELLDVSRTAKLFTLADDPKVAVRMF